MSALFTNPTPEATREQRLRRLASRRDLILRKDRARSWNPDHQGGWMICDPYTNTIVAGSRFELSLDDVEAWFEEPTE